MATPYETPGWMAILLGSSAWTSRAKSSRSRSDSQKASGGTIRVGTLLRRIARMPAASATLGSGPM